MKTKSAVGCVFSAAEKRAEAHAVRGNNFRARRVLAKIVRTAASAPAHLYWARLSWKSDLAGALDHLGRALALDPRCGFAHCFRGELLRRTGDPDAALADLNRGLRLPVTDSRVYLWRAKTLWTFGRRAEAFVDFERALRMAPRRPRSRADYGFALEDDGDLSGAEREYGLALRWEKDGPLDIAEAIETAASQDEMLAWLYFRRFLVRAKAGKIGPALKDLSAAHSRDPKYGWDGRVEGIDGLAEGTLGRFLSRSPRNGSLRAWSGYSNLARGHFEEADKELGQALRLGSRTVWVFAWRAQARMRLGRNEEAWRDARNASARDSRYPLLLGVQSELELRRGRFTAAVRLARQAIRVYPHAAWAYGLLGEGLLGLGRRRPARAAVDQALEWSPGYASAARLRELTFLKPKAFRERVRALRAAARESERPFERGRS